MKERLDVLLWQRRLCSSRERGKERILAGQVFVDGVCVMKPGTKVEEDCVIALEGEELPFVSRGGLKLDKVVRKYGLDLTGLVCMDVGASTGGFTDCMLQNGATKVYAVDVGTDQLAQSLREDSRVISMEQTNIREVTKGQLGELVDFVSIDVSFVSLTKILDAVASLMTDGSRGVFLIKPQFEAGRECVGKHGVVKDKKAHATVLLKVVDYAISVGFVPLQLDYSPICGQNGNIEYLLYAMYRPEEASVEYALTKQQAERIRDEAFLYHSKQGKGS